MIEDDTHDKLVKAFIDYSKANEWWETGHTHRSYYATYKCLQKIRKLAKALSDENKAYFQKNIQKPRKKG